MFRLVQTTFDEPTDLKALTDVRLVVHQRTDPSRAKHLAIFAHGLGGKRYGKKATWGDFPRLIFEDFTTVDVGLYSYRTLGRRLKFWRSIELEDEAIALADLIKGLTQYQSLILLGHSMGGLLCKGAIAHLVVTPESEETAQKLSGMFLMATPQLGSTKVSKLFGWITKDSRVLRAHSRYVTNIEITFRDYVHSGISYSLEPKLHVPCFALVASDDFWVDRLSAGIGLGSNQLRTIGGTHTSIVKPKDRNDEGFSFVSFCLRRAIVNSEKPRRKYECVPARMDELRVVNELAVKWFGEQVSSLDLMRDWWTVNERIFWILHRITTAPAYRNVEVVGYFCVIPVTAEGKDILRSGAVTGATIPASAIVPTGEVFDSVYVGAIAGTDMVSKAHISISLTTYIESLAANRRLDVLTRPVTGDGLRVAEQNEMEPVAEPGLGHVYATTLGQ